MVVNKSKAAFRTIAEVADMLGVGTHVLRFWETKFNQIKPLKMNGGRRYYRPDDVKLLECIQKLLHNERYTIEGVQKLFKEKGIKNFVGNTILDDLFAEEINETEPNCDENTSSLSSDIIKDIIEELSSIKSELQKVI
ncbi:MAG: MerR family transcriptional regulator [Alphaproteobacteria bacterium]|nr:MerR family transcriptional regulator [Alphaproteobacteria bacterium]